MKTKVYTKVMVQSDDNWEYYYDLRKWCTANFGPSKINGRKDYHSPWRAVSYTAEFSSQYAELICPSAFYFRNPAHATMFSLVWAEKFGKPRPNSSN